MFFKGNKQSISMINNKVYINGKLQETEEKSISITIEGNVESVDVDCCNRVVIKGDCGKVSTTSGDIDAHNVLGDVKTVSGDVSVKQGISGNVRTVSGDITKQ